jgi:hypothetical protein
MPERRISDNTNLWQPSHCTHPEHYPASMVVREAGTYEHECPACHNVMRFVVPPKASLMVML